MWVFDNTGWVLYNMGMTLQRIPSGYDPFNRTRPDVNRVMRLNFEVRVDGDPVPERNRLQGGNFADRATRVRTVAETIAEQDPWIEPNSGFSGGFPIPGGGYLNIYARGRRFWPQRKITALQMAERIVP